MLKMKPGPKPKHIFDRFLKHVDLVASGCLEWTGSKYNGGEYGCFYVGNRKTQLAHRWIWEYLNGEIPSGMCVCHKCDNPSCVNINHLFLGTASANMRDKVAKGRHFIPDAFKRNGAKGERNAKSKLTKEQVLVIRESDLPLKELASQYGVSKESISAVIRGKTWRHI